MEDREGIVEHDMKSTLEMLIDEHMPDLSVPGSILRSCLVETLAQPGGREMISTLVSPVLGLTVGTALVECRRNRWAPTMNVPESLFLWLYEQGVDLTQPDRKGNTGFFHALLFDVSQGFSLALRDNVYSNKVLEGLFQEGGFDPLIVSPSGQSVLQCPGQSLVGRDIGVEVLQRVVPSALAKVVSLPERWRIMMAMEAGGVAPPQQTWWRQVRRECQNGLLDEKLPDAAPKGRTRF